MRLLWAIAMFGCLTASANAQTPYDGMWNVTTQTRTGSCEPTAHYAMTVVDGKVSGPANVSGTVSRSGNVRVSIGAAYANGQLDGSAGSGKWNGASGGVPAAAGGRRRNSEAEPQRSPHSSKASPSHRCRGRDLAFGGDVRLHMDFGLLGLGRGASDK